MHRFTRVAVRATAIALASAACHDAAPTAPSPSGGALSTTSPAVVVADERPEEAHFAALAARYPSFAGYHIDSTGNLVVSTTGAASDDALRNEMTAFARTIPISAHEGITERGVVFRRVPHSYDKLAKTRDRLERDLTDAEIVSFDLDEVANRVGVGVERSTGGTKRAKVAASARRLGIPDEVLDVVEVDRPKPLVGVRTAAEQALTASGAAVGTLNGYQRPLAGGLELDFRHVDFTTDYCTLGFVSDFEGARRLTTNSHCSLYLWQNDNAPYAQGNELSNDTFDGLYVGQEYRDPNPTWNCNWESCRESDANFISAYNPAEAPVGYIARTTPPIGRGFSAGSGSKVIDQANPTIVISDHERGLVAGITLDKVGARTGWTSGRVTQTCKDLRADDGYIRKCTHYLDTYVDRGDSGSPIFLYQGSTAILYGVLWGGTGSSALYSGFRSIEYDFGVRDLEQVRVTP